MPKSNICRKPIIVLLLLTTIALFTAFPAVTRVRAQKLQYSIEDNTITVTGPEFDIVISKGGGINEYRMGGARVLGETDIAFWGPGWSGFTATAWGSAPTKEPDIEETDWGLKITTYSRLEAIAGNVNYDVTAVFRIYKTGAVVVSFELKCIKPSDFAGAAVFVSYACETFKNKYFAAFKGRSKVFEVEKLPPEHEPGSGFWTIKSGTFSVAYASGPGLNIILAYLNPPEINTELSDEREWGGNEYATKGWVQDLIPKKEGGTVNFTWILFPHTKGPSFNERVLKILQMQAQTQSYILKVERIARSASAVENLKKSKELLPQVLRAICMADLDKAESLVTQAFNYAKTAFTIEFRRTTTFYIIIPMVVCVVLAGYAIRRWARTWKAERTES
ncbi:MAG: hypothetical protein J7J99_07365 [Thermoprotei archaeon]|nr:hypothetical protein [Thermoprotei archaeon]